MRLSRGFVAWRTASFGLLMGFPMAITLLGQQSQFQGSVPMGAVSPTPMALTFHDAIDRALKANLGLLVSDSASESARGQRLHALSALLPQLDAGWAAMSCCQRADGAAG